MIIKLKLYLKKLLNKKSFIKNANKWFLKKKTLKSIFGYGTSYNMIWAKYFA